MARLCLDAQLASGHCLCRCAHSLRCSLLCAGGVGSRSVIMVSWGLSPWRALEGQWGRQVAHSSCLPGCALHMLNISALYT